MVDCNERFNERDGSTGASMASGGGDYAVAEYRAYTVGRDGHFIGFEPLVCANDAEAIEQAKRLVVNHAIELWSGVRLVVRLEAKTT
jgi:hypothetical protein